ncbi:MAG: SCO family protein, partial [Rubrivivax sp.]|nr:SCO family protein [Rubrivivax sp.]
MAVSRRLLITAGLAAALTLPACDKAPGGGPAFKAIDITGAEYARDFDLSDADGQRRKLADFKGRVVVVFFGFTQCPDVCTATLLELSAVKKAMGAEGDRVQGIFVTVDPERD